MIPYVIELKKQGPLNDWEVPYFVRNFYDQVFNISQRCYMIKDGRHEVKAFDQSTNPLRMVSKTVREGLGESAQLRKRAWEYRTYRINEQQGITFDKWLELPPHILDGILNDIRREEQLRSQITTSPVPSVPARGDINAQRMDAMFEGSKAL